MVSVQTAGGKGKNILVYVQVLVAEPQTKQHHLLQLLNTNPVRLTPVPEPRQQFILCSGLSYAFLLKTPLPFVSAGLASGLKEV